MMKETILRGSIIPHSLDSDGFVISVAVSMSDKREFPVEMNGIGISLMKQINQRVRLEGIIRQDKDQMKHEMIKVMAYEILNWEE